MGLDEGDTLAGVIGVLVLGGGASMAAQAGAFGVLLARAGSPLGLGLGWGDNARGRVGSVGLPRRGRHSLGRGSEGKALAVWFSRRKA